MSHLLQWRCIIFRVWLRSLRPPSPKASGCCNIFRQLEGIVLLQQLRGLPPHDCCSSLRPESEPRFESHVCTYSIFASLFCLSCLVHPFYSRSLVTNVFQLTFGYPIARLFDCQNRWLREQQDTARNRRCWEIFPAVWTVGKISQQRFGFYFFSAHWHGVFLNCF